MIYVFRHGDKVIADSEQNYNSSLGIVDDPLSEKGQQDARRILSYCKGVDIKAIYVSQYKRAYQTAEPTALSKGIPIVIDSRLNEINNGELRNMSDEEVAVVYPQLWKDFCAHKHDVHFPGGESGQDVLLRQDSFLSDIKNATNDIMIVSHDGYIRLLMCNILGLPPHKRYKFKTQMGAVSIFDHSGGEWEIIKFNQSI